MEHGNTTKHWAMGTLGDGGGYIAARATQTSYDADNRAVAETVPGNSAPTTTTYNEQGQVLQQTDPDGSFHRFTYDTNGNTLTDVTPLHDYDPGQPNQHIATLTNTFDLASRLATATPQGRITTSHSYDLLGREIGAQGGSRPASGTIYNWG